MEEKGVPQKKNVFLIVLLSIITLGIYPAYWYSKRIKELNNLKTEQEISTTPAVFYFGCAIALVILEFMLISSIITYPERYFSEISFTTSQIVLVAGAQSILLITIIISLYLAFKTRSIINSAIFNKGLENLKISKFFTFIFNLFYLQYEMNRVILNKEREKRTAPWIIFIFIFVAIAIGIFYYFYKIRYM